MQIDRRSGAPTMEFHVARDSRDRYRFDESLYTITGNVIFANFHAARLFAQRMNQKRDLANFPEQAVKSSQINALALIHELTHYMFRIYREQFNPQLLEQSLSWLTQQVGPQAVDAALKKFADQFPALLVYRREQDIDTYLAGQTDGMPNRQIVLEEMLMLWLENANPAFAPFMELFDDQRLEKETAYPSIMSSIYDYFDSVAGVDRDMPTGGRAAGPFDTGENLIDILLAPARAAPHSLEAQLEFIRARWGASLGKHVYRLLGGLDLIKEEEKPVFFGPGPIELPVFDFAARDVERFSKDKDWMPQLVLMAKNAYVWLDQLAQAYARPVRTLDEVPDEELDKLASWGVSGLWLIGLWERSAASQRVKQMMGNPEAVASAYSLFDYQIAAKLGGEAACQDLRSRAWQRGIRLASDMVPNHVGIDGKWVIEHPDWFVSVDQSPYPSYSFNGPDLSWNPGVGIYLEDHYYDRSDAAVVFKRVEHSNGSARYIYHGNDGTSMPWNDTAQLSYVRADVREAVIQTILHVARQFPVIRFDAAMTLAKKHVERLWHPLPGHGGAIPSRAEHSLSRRDFERAIPTEFWREVVDRVAAEAPGTLLLAEAFWLMEGYFVRTLGMHRVYNSAFMNLLRDERNADYRRVMRETLEFDPEILKRFVNFVNNPDERTAVEQFGTGDKYFGVATLMATMPGLPMFGHGQFEGFTEKYGMEFRRARMIEEVNEGLYAHHQRVIVPLLHRRAQFAQVGDFLLYDVAGDEGDVREDVFAYSNIGPNGERSLVVFHNRFADTSGWIRESVGYSVKVPDSAERTLVRRTLGEGLRLGRDGGTFWVARDTRSGLEHIWPAVDLADHGLRVDLHAYECRVFLDWREVPDDADGTLRRLAERLRGGGVASIDDARAELALEPVREPFWRLLEPGVVRAMVDAAGRGGFPAEAVAALEGNARWLAEAAHAFGETSGPVTPIAELAANLLVGLRAVVELAATQPKIVKPEASTVGVLLAWLASRGLGGGADVADRGRWSVERFDAWRIGAVAMSMFRGLGMDEAAAGRAVDAVRALLSLPRWPAVRRPAATAAATIARSWLDDRVARQALRVHDWDGTLWLEGDAWSELVDRSLAVEAVRLAEEDAATPAALRSATAVAKALRGLCPASGYRVDALQRLIQPAPGRSSRPRPRR